LIYHRDRSFGFLQIIGDFGELGEGGLEVFNDFGGDDVGIGKVRAVFEAFNFYRELRFKPLCFKTIV
jgi:hypothetical protein